MPHPHRIAVIHGDGIGTGEPDAAAAVLAAVETVLARGGDTLTPDMGGTATTETLGKAVADAVTAP